MELETLVKRGACFYECFGREGNGPKYQKTCLVVLFFDDAIIDAQAEVMKLKSQMKDLPVLVDF